MRITPKKCFDAYTGLNLFKPLSATLIESVTFYSYTKYFKILLNITMYYIKLKFILRTFNSYVGDKGWEFNAFSIFFRTNYAMFAYTQLQFVFFFNGFIKFNFTFFKFFRIFN